MAFGIADWISSADVLSRVRNRCGFHDEATKLLDHWASTAHRRSRAEAYVEELDIGPISIELPSSISDRVKRISAFRSGQYADLRAALWSNQVPVFKGARLWNWETGIFAFAQPGPDVLIYNKAASGASKPVGTRFVFFEVEFSRAEFEAFIKTIPNAARFAARNAGPRLKNWDYAPVMARLESMILDGTITRFGALKRRGTQAKIMEEIIKSLTTEEGEGPPEPTARRKAREIMDQWHKFEASGGNERS